MAQLPGVLRDKLRFGGGVLWALGAGVVLTQSGPWLSTVRGEWGPRSLLAPLQPWLSLFTAGGSF